MLDKIVSDASVKAKVAAVVPEVAPVVVADGKARNSSGRSSRSSLAPPAPSSQSTPVPAQNKGKKMGMGTASLSVQPIAESPAVGASLPSDHPAGAPPPPPPVPAAAAAAAPSKDKKSKHRVKHEELDEDVSVPDCLAVCVLLLA